MNRILLVLFPFLLVAACTPDEDVPIVPEIIYKSYFIEPDTVTQFNEDKIKVVFEYIDGDGDIGNPSTDTLNTPVIFADYFEKRNGECVQIQPQIGGDTLAYEYPIPSLTPEGENKAIRGEITITIDAYILPRNTLKELKYRIYLVDRMGHESNVIETPVIQYNTP